jgi:hypothetical protein
VMRRDVSSLKWPTSRRDGAARCACSTARSSALSRSV